MARTAHQLAARILSRRTEPGEPARKGKTRHLFATAITPIGPMNYLPDTARRAELRIILSGGPGMGGDEVLHRVADELVLAGINCEILHCPLDPKRYEHVYVPSLSSVVMTSADPHPIEPQPGDETVDLGVSIDHRALEPFKQEIVEATCLYDEAFTIAVESISRAKHLHDLMETCYVPYMDFERINARRAEILDRILKLAREKGYNV